MTVDTGLVSSRLLELQTIDQRIRETREQVESFDATIAAVDEPVRRLADEVEITSNRVRELRLEERRLRLAAEGKRGRVQRLEERLNMVRTIREEAAVQAELGLVRRALDQEELDVVSLLEQIGRFEDRLEIQREGLEEAQSAVGPRKSEILAEQEGARAQLATLETERELCATGLDKRYLMVYDNLARGGRRDAVAPMTADGACGSCFSLIPLQVQNEIRTSAPLVRCEACGVIVTAPMEAPEDASPETAIGG